MSTFDAKINNENMTKCLQSLKEMYQDLNTRNIYCPLEAEFRLYSVLVKLNDGDILRSVQQNTDTQTVTDAGEMSLDLFAKPRFVFLPFSRNQDIEMTSLDVASNLPRSELGIEAHFP